MKKMPLGASTWSLYSGQSNGILSILDGREPLTSENVLSVREFFKEMVDEILLSEIGYVELWSSPILEDEGVFDQLQRLAVDGRIHSTHSPFGKDLDISSMSEEVRNAGIEACVSAAKLLAKLGGKILVVHGSVGIPDEVELAEREKNSAESIAKIADECDKLGIKVAVEILAKQTVGNSANSIISLLEKINRPNVGVCVDVNHVFPPSEVAPAIRMLCSKILTLHISDYDGEHEKHWLPMGGVLDWKGIVSALNDIGYNGPFMYEVRFEANSFAEAIQTIVHNYEAVVS